MFKDHLSKGKPGHHSSKSSPPAVRDFLVPTLLPEGNFRSEIAQVRGRVKGESVRVRVREVG